MNRRLTVALAATAAFGLGLAPVAAAAKKNEIRIVGGTKFKAGKFVKDDVRFKPATLTVKSGATVKVVNKADEPAPHTISFVEKKFLPKGFEFPAMDALLAAHDANPETEEIGFFQVDDGVGVPNDQAGVLEVDSLGNADNAGDSQFIAPGQGTSFKVTAKKGSTLYFYCAIHPWMQGKLKVN
jgi:plastocyanin